MRFRLFIRKNVLKVMVTLSRSENIERSGKKLALRAQSNHVTLSKSENIQLPLKAQSNHPWLLSRRKFPVPVWGGGMGEGGVAPFLLQLT